MQLQRLRLDEHGNRVDNKGNIIGDEEFASGQSEDEEEDGEEGVYHVEDVAEGRRVSPRKLQRKHCSFC